MQKDSPDNQSTDSINSELRKKEKRILKILFWIFALLLLWIWSTLALIGYLNMHDIHDREKVPEFNMFQIESYSSTDNSATVNLKIKDEISKTLHFVKIVN